MTQENTQAVSARKQVSLNSGIQIIINFKLRI